MGYDWANPITYMGLKEKAKHMKMFPTEAESCLWEHLRSKQLGVRFRRQYIIDEFIVDFVCLPKRLIIEADGAYHQEEEQQKNDAMRTERLNALGFNVIRFSNDEILGDINNIINKIKAIL